MVILDACLYSLPCRAAFQSCSASHCAKPQKMRGDHQTGSLPDSPLARLIVLNKS